MVTDIPCVLFAEELISVFPKAKIILTTRSASSWHRSMLRTIHALQKSYFTRLSLLVSSRLVLEINYLLKAIIQCYFKGDIDKFGLDVFNEHNERVREIVRREGREFLEFRIEEGDGWGALCTFLGKEKPIVVADREFPRVNDSKAFREAFGLEWNWTNRGIIILVTAIVVGAWVLGYSDDVKKLVTGYFRK